VTPRFGQIKIYRIAFVQTEESSLQSRNSISGSYYESEERKFVEWHFEISTQIDILLTQSLIHPLSHALHGAKSVYRS